MQNSSLRLVNMGAKWVILLEATLQEMNASKRILKQPDTNNVNKVGELQSVESGFKMEVRTSLV